MSHARYATSVPYAGLMMERAALYLHVILNGRSGTATKLGLTRELLSEKLITHGQSFDIDDDDERPFEDRLERARQSHAQVILAAGGDGTITSIAAGLIGSDKTLAILPLGTANLLARDLGIPLDVDEALSTIDAMFVREIDAAFVNEHLFLHKVVVGTFPEIAAEREKLREQTSVGSGLTFLRSSLSHIAQSRRMAIALRPAGQRKAVRRVHAVAVANNGYAQGIGKVFARESLDRGVLTVYLLKRLTPFLMIRMATEMALGRWRQDDAIEFEETKAITIDTRASAADVMIDGEIERMATPLEFKMKARALRVLAPAKPE